jgi:hypothetical protein
MLGCRAGAGAADNIASGNAVRRLKTTVRSVEVIASMAGLPPRLPGSFTLIDSPMAALFKKN